MKMSSKIFGRQVKLDWFNLNSETTFLNHGSYGAVPKKIFDEKIRLQYEIENNPDKWFRYTSLDLWNKSLKSLANYLNVGQENLLICENATESINSVLKAVSFEYSKDAILATEHTYQAILNSIDYTSKYRFNEAEQINVTQVPIKFPIKSVPDMLNIFDETCRIIHTEKKLRIKLSVIDHISSATAMKFPIKEINQIIRKWNSEAIILIDGAHALGQTEIQLNNFDCDFYVSNLHKWFLAPKACSFLYIKDTDKYKTSLQPCVISHGYNKDLSYNFYQRGTSDKTSWFLVDNCIDFYENSLGGFETITRYNGQLLDEAVKLLVESWETKTLEIPKEMEAPFMKMIELPILKDYPLDNKGEISLKLIKDLLDQYSIVCVIVYVQNKLYCRISGYVYNCLEDYIKLRDAILELKN